MHPALEVADIFRRHGPAYVQAHDGHLGRVERRVMSAIELCRTSALGGHVEGCRACGTVHVAFNSCRNRHCPKCQGVAARDWLAARADDLLPVPYFHVVFTLPAEIAAIAFQNKTVVYGILFKSAAETLRIIAADPRHLIAADRRDWVVYAKPPFGGPEHVLAYLSRYTHRVAIANSRLVSTEGGKVTFRWRDYRHGRRPRHMTLDAGEFIRRFLLHTLPDGVHRIRHYGFLANGQRAARLAACRALLADRAPQTTVHATPATKQTPVPRPCPCCGRPMATITVWYHGQQPPNWPFWNDSS